MVLEPYVWQSVDNILEREDIDLDEFCSRVDEARINSSLASATRMIVLTYFRLSDQLNSRQAIIRRQRIFHHPHLRR